MDKNFESYLKVYHNFIDDETCDTTVAEMEQLGWQQHTFYNPTNGSYTNRSGNRELDISYDKVSTREVLMKKVWDGLSRYLTDINFPWFNSWAGYSGIRFNKYSEDRVMAEHCDHIHSMFDGEMKGIPTLSFVGQLNDDFVGGEFVMWKDKIIEMHKGTVIVFPSVFLFPHRVDAVKSGTRYSFVSWAY
jgi:hypothetical protein